MSQYPPQPSFRGQFNPNPQLTPSSSAAHHAMPQFPYSFRDPNNQSLPSAQYAHSHSYNTTSHSANASLAVPGAPQAPYVGFGQTPNGSFLAPPYPPIPPPYGVFPQPPSLAHHREPSLGSIQPHISLPLKPPPVAAMIGDSNFEKTQIVTANISELEDGELSDGELDRDQRDSASDVLKASRHPATRDNGSPSKIVNDNGEKPRKIAIILKTDHDKENRGARVGDSPHENSLANSLNNLTTQVQECSNPQDPAQPVPLRSSINNSSTDQIGQQHRNSGDSRSSSHSMMRIIDATSGSIPEKSPSICEAVDATDVSRNDSSQEDDALHRKWQDLHNRARDALKQLHDDGIGFAQIANEGIDPSILRNLYAELGIPVPLMTQEKQNRILRTAVDSASSSLDITELPRRVVKNVPKKAGENAIDIPKKSTQSAQKPEMFKDAPNGSNSKGVTNQASSPLTKNISNLGKPPVGGNTSALDSHTLNLQSSPTLSKPIQTTKPPKLATNNLRGKPTASKSGDKALERKDYIARMLAAKAGKPISTANSAVSPTAPISRSKEVAAQTPSVGGNRPDSVERCVYVDNIPHTATEVDIKNLFSGFEMTSESVSIEEVLRTNKSTGSGVVVLSSATETQRAISELSGKHILDQRVSIQLARKTDGAAHAIEIAVQAEAQSATKVVSNSISKSEMYSKANKKAQTELARQKIEALKNRVNIPPPTDDHRSNVQGSPPNQEQPKPVEKPQSKLLQQELQVASNPAVISQTQGSFFMPSNRKPAFIIPGLFMDSTPLEPSMLLQKFHVQPLTEEPQDKLEMNHRTELGNSEPESPTVHSQIAAVVDPPITSILPVYPEAQKPPLAIVQATNESRKRQKAADFIDSPSTRVRRPLGQNEETSVIIEISEDEMNESTEDEMDIDDDIAMDIDDDNGQHTPPKQLFSNESSSGKPKSIRDLPPLSDLPGRKKIPSNPAVVTPPAAQTPNKSREPETLKVKEKEIELMNRRIAELEQRIKAKQTASRAQTPGTPGSSPASPKLPGASIGSHEMPNPGIGEKSSNHHVKDQSEDRNLSGAAEIAEADGIVETAEIAATSKAAAAVETAHLAEAAEAVEAAKTAEIVRVAEATRLAELARVTEAAEAAEAVEQERILVVRQEKALQLAKADAERLRAAEAAAAEEEKQRQARRVEIESGLPILDAEVERTKQKLESLKKAMDELSREVEKGIEGRRVLMAELDRLTPSKPPIYIQEATLMNGSGTHAPDPVEERYEISSSDHQSDTIERQQKVQGRPDNNESGRHSPLLPVPVVDLPKIVDDSPAINENKDVMDTSPDVADDAEVTDYSPEPPTNIPVTPGSVDVEEVYEPPVTVDAISIPPAFPPDEDLGHEMRMVETAMSQTALSAPPSDVDDPKSSEESKIISDPFHDIHTQIEPPASIRSTNLADASDSDDYEPPEPSPPVENTLLFPVNAVSDKMSSLHEPAAGASTPSHPISANSITIVKETIRENVIGSIDKITRSAHGEISNASVAKFSPYESPLKQFKSYRYHPDYLSEVPLGFRSLTYSHDIDPEKAVCRFEAAGGVCNDNSCDGQHFRNMSLSDDMVLVQMGAIPEGLTSQEGDEYANGLRRIIQEIRGRKVRDFNAVASEITAYRAKFLGDNLKVLPL